MSESAPQDQGPQDQERHDHQAFATRHADKAYQPLLNQFHDRCRQFNHDHFEGRLKPPHIGCGLTASRSVGECTRHTGYGGSLQITLNAGLAFGTRSEWVVNPQGPGHVRLLDDLLLRYTVRQFVLEVGKVNEAGYRGYGPRFAREANRVGQTLGLGKVVPRRRKGGDDGAACLHWPHCVRPLDYYGADVTEALLALARGEVGKGDRTGGRGATRGCVALVCHFLGAGRGAALGRIMEEHAARMERRERQRWRPLRKVEAGEVGVNGELLGEVTVRVEWLEANGGLVRQMVEAIVRGQALGELPLLAAALEEAGCQDQRVLGHLRADLEHTTGCWVLRKLREAKG